MPSQFSPCRVMKWKVKDYIFSYIFFAEKSRLFIPFLFWTPPLSEPPQVADGCASDLLDCCTMISRSLRRAERERVKSSQRVRCVVGEVPFAAVVGLKPGLSCAGDWLNLQSAVPQLAVYGALYARFSSRMKRWVPLVVSMRVSRIGEFARTNYTPPYLRAGHPMEET